MAEHKSDTTMRDIIIWCEDKDVLLSVVMKLANGTVNPNLVETMIDRHKAHLDRQWFTTDTEELLETLEQQNPA